MPRSESAPPGDDVQDGWVEPAALLPLHWGAYRPRLVLGLAAIVVGTALIQLTSTFSLFLLLAGSLLQPAGWAVLPTPVGRRVAVVLPSLGFTWLMLGGSSFAWCIVVLLAAWLLVRLRPAISYVVLVLPIASGVVLSNIVTDYSGAWFSLLVSVAVTAGAAWIARGLAILWSRRRPRSARSRQSASRDAGRLG